MDLTEIKYAVAKRGLTFVAIDKMFNLRRGAVRFAINIPHRAGEKALADALCVHPSKIFPNRYDENGKRYEPQPSENYEYVSKKGVAA